MGMYKIVTIDDHGWITSAQNEQLADPSAYASDEAQFGTLSPPDNPVRLAPSAQPPQIGTEMVDDGEGGQVEVPVYAPWTDCKVVDFAVVPMTEAEITERIAEQEATEAARIAALAEIYGQKVGEFAQMLSVFSLTMPITEDEAASAMYVAVKADVNKTADSQMVMAIYNGLRSHLSNDDIYAIAKFINVAE